MTDPKLDPFPLGVDRFLRAERAAAEVPPADIERAFARIDAAIALRGSVSGSSTGEPHAGANVNSAPKSGVVARALARKPVTMLMAAAALGGVLGAAAHARFADGGARPAVTIERPIPTGIEATTVPSLPSSSASSFLIVPPSSSAPPLRDVPHTSPGFSASPPSPAADASAERLLIEAARAAVARGDAAAALVSLRRHEQSYPKGVLTEEREALAIQALVLAGSHDAARVRARRFHVQFPESMFGPSVDAALAPIP